MMYSSDEEQPCEHELVRKLDDMLSNGPNALLLQAFFRQALIVRLSTMTVPQLQQLESILLTLAIDYLGEINSLDLNERECLVQSSLSETALIAFNEKCNQTFTAAKMTQKHSPKIYFQGEHFETYAELIAYWGKNIHVTIMNPSEIITPIILQKIREEMGDEDEPPNKRALTEEKDDADIMEIEVVTKRKKARRKL